LAALFVLLATSPARGETEQTVNDYTDDVASTETTLRNALTQATDPSSNIIHFLHTLTYLPKLTLTNGSLSITTPVNLNTNYADVHGVTIAYDNGNSSRPVFFVSSSAAQLSLTGDAAIVIDAKGNNNSVTAISAPVSSLNIGAIGSNVTLKATATASTYGEATGLYADGDILVASGLAGTITATVAGTGGAYGLRATNGISITGGLSANITSTAGVLGDAYGLSAGGAISITGGMSGDIAATGGGNGRAYGLYASDGITIAGGLSGDITVKGEGSGSVHGLYAASGGISISGGLSGQVAATAEGIGDAYGLKGTGITITGGLSGSVAATATSGKAYGLYAGGNINGGDASTPLSISGSVTAEAGNIANAYAIYATGSVNLYVSGTITVTDGSLFPIGGYAIYAAGSNNVVTLTNTADLGDSWIHLGGGTLNLVGENGTFDTITEGVTSLVIGGNGVAASWTVDSILTSFGSLTVSSNASLILNSSVTIAGNITLTGSLTWNLAADKAYAGVISGSSTGSLIKDGTGTLTLSGANAYSGATTVKAGTLQAGAANTFSSTSPVTVDPGATLALDGYSQTIRSLAGAGSVTLGSNASTVLTINDYWENTTFSGTISGSGGLAKTGTKTLILSGSNAYDGATVVTRGTLQAGATNTFSSNSAVTVGSEGTLALDGYSQTIGGLAGLGRVTLGSNAATVLTINGGSSSSTYSGTISGSGGLAKTGSGTLTLAGYSTYSGGTTVTQGTLAVSTGSALGTGTLTLGGGTLQATTSLGLANAMVVAATSAISLDAGIELTLTGNVSGSGALTKSGYGTLTLTGNNSGFSGAVTVSAGTLVINSASNLGTGTLTLNGGLLLTTADISDLANAVVIDSSGGTFYTNGSNLTLSGTITGPGALTKSGYGTLTLSGTNTYSGATSITGGTLSISSAGNLQGTSGVTLDGGTLQATSTLTLGKSIALGSGGGTFDVANSGDSLTLSGKITGDGSLTKTGPGVLYLTGNNTYTGGTNINGGTINIIANANLGNPSGGLTFNGGTLQLGADVVSSRDVTLKAGGGTFDTNGHDLTLNGTVSGPGGLTKTGAGTLTLSGDATYTGSTSIRAGTLSLGGSCSSSSMDVASGATLNFAPTKTVTYAGTITGSGHVTKTGDSMLTLSGDNSAFTGDLTLTGGTLSVSNDNNLGTSTASLAFNGGTLATTASMTITQPITVNSGGGALNNSGNALTLTNSLSGSGDLTFAGSGTVNLGASFNGSAYGGTLSVSGGTLHLVDGETLAGTLTIASGATLNGVGKVGNLNVNGVISPGNSPGTITVTGDYAQSGSGTYICQVTPTANDLIAVTGNATLSGTISIQPEYTYYKSGTVWTVLTTQTGVVSGTYPTVVYGSTPENWIFVPVYSANAVTITLVRQSYSTSITSSQASSVGLSLDAVAYNATGEMASLLQNLDYSYGTTNAQFNAGYISANALTNYALNVLSAEVYDLFSQNVFAAGRLLASAQHAGLHEGEESAGQGFASPLEIGPASLASQNNQYGLGLGLDTTGGGASSLSFGRLGVFVRPIGMRVLQQGSSSQTGYATVSGGITGGVLYRPFPELTLAVAPGFVTQSINIHSEGGGQGTTSDWSLGLLAAYRSGPWHADAGVRGAYNAFQSSRSLPLPSGSYTAKGIWDGWNVNASIGGGYDFTAGDYTIGPLAAMSWQRLHENAFKESGAGTLGQSIRARNTEALNTVLGARVARTFETSAGDVTPEVRVGWSVQWLGESQNMVASFIGSPGSAYQVKSTNHAYNSALVDVGLSMRVSSKLTATARAGVELFRPGYESQAASIGLKYTF
jgi:autotransporter-associated beta strand protein